MAGGNIGVVKSILPSLVGAIALTIGAGAPAHAALLVDWGGNYVSAQQAFSNPTPSDGKLATQYGGFSGSNPLLLSPGTGYGGTSDIFYGQVVRTAGAGTFTNLNGNVPTAIVQDNSSSDRLQVQLINSAASALFLWQQPDFLNGLNTGTLNFATGSTVSFTVDTYVNAVPGRAVLESGGSYYISNAVFSGTGTTTVDLTTLSWFNYDPVNAIGTIGSSASLVSGGVISNVTEVGFYTGVANAPSNAVRVSSVEFNYVPVPEPSGFALLAAGIGLMVIRRKHSKA